MKKNRGNFTEFGAIPLAWGLSPIFGVIFTKIGTTFLFQELFLQK